MLTLLLVSDHQTTSSLFILPLQIRYPSALTPIQSDSLQLVSACLMISAQIGIPDDEKNSFVRSLLEPELGVVKGTGRAR